ncbi:zinc finger protein 62 homolog isoform X2 [Macrosteles quadrilineatus]|uniref:zinc finger protein 62 homolog isoform X2 n=1 Tax=Macrosteles quadrilineatus TaxID=74068 RepID=UPI0023E2C38E|nr:zinc finger protein 62 homolog isoform X2 [Macrosteles quadrilineatus]
MSVTKNVEVLCRICSEENNGTNIYGDEGIRNKLEAKIRSYLHIEVSKDDLLPKTVCISCSEKLDGHHEFALMALKVQDKLYSLVNGHDYTSSSKKKEEYSEDSNDVEEEQEEVDDDEEDCDEEESEDNEEEEEADCNDNGEDNEEMEHSGSLLHSILTNGRQSESAEGSESMEVRVDPMLFFSGQDDNSVDGEESTQTNKELKDGKPYQCSVCPRGFNSEISLQNHLWSHLSRRVLSDTDLNSRLRSKGGGKGTVYSSNGVLHTVGGLPVTHPHQCPICGRLSSTKGNLKVHLETHRPKGKYACDICGRIFKTQSNLYRHKEYHGGDQFTCEVCARVYPTKSTLRAHSITHSDLRPHQCPLCDKTFKRNQDLKFHINQHTGARPYKCPFCPKAFASSGNCFSHRKRMHPGELERYKEMANGYVQ